MYKPVVRGAFCAVLVAAVLPAQATAQSRGLVPEDYFNLATVGQVTVSPAGDLVAFTVTSVNATRSPAGDTVT